jgi:hypothetical protein
MKTTMTNKLFMKIRRCIYRIACLLSVAGLLVLGSCGREQTTVPPDSEPLTIAPSTPDPSTPDPSTPDPSTPDPSTPDPPTPDPPITDPSTTDPSTTDPSTPDPSTPDPSTPDPSFSVSTHLVGTKWKVVGIVDVETGVLTEIVPMKGYLDVKTGRLIDGETFDCEKCYTFTFESFKYYPSAMDTAMSAYGWSILNKVNALFFEPIQITSTNIPFARTPWCGGTEIGEAPTPTRYLSALEELTSYIYNNNELKLFYNSDKNYLLYKLIE